MKKVFNVCLTGDIEIDEDDEDEHEDKGGSDGAEAILRDFQYQLKCQFMEKGRNLRVTWLYSCHLFYRLYVEYKLLHNPKQTQKRTALREPPSPINVMICIDVRSAQQWSASSLRVSMVPDQLSMNASSSRPTRRATRCGSQSFSKLDMFMG